MELNNESNTRFNSVNLTSEPDTQLKAFNQNTNHLDSTKIYLDHNDPNISDLKNKLNLFTKNCRRNPVIPLTNTTTSTLENSGAKSEISKSYSATIQDISRNSKIHSGITSQHNILQLLPNLGLKREEESYFIDLSQFKNEISPSTVSRTLPPNYRFKGSRSGYIQTLSTIPSGIPSDYEQIENNKKDQEYSIDISKQNLEDDSELSKEVLHTNETKTRFFHTIGACTDLRAPLSTSNIAHFITKSGDVYAKCMKKASSVDDSATSKYQELNTSRVMFETTIYQLNHCIRDLRSILDESNNDKNRLFSINSTTNQYEDIKNCCLQAHCDVGTSEFDSLESQNKPLLKLNTQEAYHSSSINGNSTISTYDSKFSTLESNKDMETDLNTPLLGIQHNYSEQRIGDRSKYQSENSTLRTKNQKTRRDTNEPLPPIPKHRNISIPNVDLSNIDNNSSNLDPVKEPSKLNNWKQLIFSQRFFKKKVDTVSPYEFENIKHPYDHLIMSIVTIIYAGCVIFFFSDLNDKMVKIFSILTLVAVFGLEFTFSGIIIVKRYYKHQKIQIHRCWRFLFFVIRTLIVFLIYMFFVPLRKNPGDTNPKSSLN